MRITRYTIEMAVLKIFRDYRVFAPGTSLFLSNISASWDHTGLRGRDLVQGIEYLLEDSCVSVERYPPTDDVLVTLLPAGGQRIVGLPHRLRGTGQAKFMAGGP